MDERNDNFQQEQWLDDVLGERTPEQELGPDESAVAAAGLIHPDDMELEIIMAEHRNAKEPEPDPAPEVSNEPTQFFAPQQPTVYSNEPEEAPEEEPEDNPEAAEEAEEEPVPKGRPKRKKGYGLLGIPHLLSTLIWLAIIVAIGTALGRTLWLCCADIMAFGKTPKDYTITITAEDTIDSIAQELGEEGVVRYPGLFKRFATLTGKDERISVGTFTINARLDYNAMINGMTDFGPSREEVDVTFPEGYTCAQIFALLEEKGVCTVAELEEHAANGELGDYWFLEGLERGDKYCLEGYLFPDTYTFYTQDEPGRVIGKFLSAFDMRFTDVMRERLVAINERHQQQMRSEGYGDDYIAAHPIGIREVVIIASLIERESANADESYNISAVIYNRLADTSQPPYLNIDAAVIYGLGGKIDPETGESIPLTQADKEIDTPYNTYLHAGLTPGAICNPGQDSLDAALVPNEENYLYYALDPSSGTHKFFSNYNEFLRFLESVEY